jgi:hypothetical protein
MKKLLLILLLSLNSVFVFAQIPLDSFYKDGAIWTNMYQTDYWASSHDHIFGNTGYVYKIYGDTIINTVKYKKLWRGLIDVSYISIVGDNYYNFMHLEVYYIGRLRTVGRKVYYVQDTNTGNRYPPGKEYLIYDFGQQIGDTLKREYLGSPSSFITDTSLLASIDSVQMESGQYIKKYTYQWGTKSDTAYEGLGGIYGLLGWNGYVGLVYPHIMCVSPVCYLSPAMLYHYDVKCTKVDWYLLKNCFDVNALDIEYATKQKQLTLYPNPSNSSVIIEGSVQAKEVNLSIYNTFGQVVYSANETVSNNYIHRKIDLQDLPKGVYRLVVQSDTKTLILPVIVE